MALDYPNNFDVPAFPAGRPIAISRFMAIASAIVLVLVLFMCAILLWAVRSKQIDPFIVSIDKLTGQWTVIAHSHESGPIEYNALESVQESVLGNFTEKWFTISGTPDENTRMWQTCDRKSDCGDASTRPYGDITCQMYCLGGEELFSTFIYDIVPGYQERVANGERWAIDKTQIQMENIGDVNANGGTWRISATVQSNINGNMDIIAFAKIARNLENYPQTLGYYVADFNAYKIN